MKIAVDVKPKMVANALVSAFEGGSNYWIQNVIIHPPKEEDQVKHLDGETFWPRYDGPLCPGGVLKIKAVDSNKQSNLHSGSIMEGLRVMAREHPRHFADMLSGEGDATTGDVLLQCCLFGEVVYG